MFRAGLLLVISRINSAYTTIGIDMRYIDSTNCCLYRVDPPDDEQQACSKYVEAYYWNKLIENSVSCWFVLYGYITMQVNKTLNLTLGSFKINTFLTTSVFPPVDH
jgi:hypothetical protein